MGSSRYIEIRFRGQVPPDWKDWFGGLTQQALEGDTLLSGFLLDQSALLGVLDVIHNLGLNLISVNCLENAPAERNAPPKGDIR